MRGHDRQGLSSLTAALEPGGAPAEPGEAPVDKGSSVPEAPWVGSGSRALSGSDR